MKISISNLPEIIRNTKVRQTFGLYSSVILSVFAGIGVSYILTHLLPKEVFGDLKFVQNICSFIVVFFTFGYFYTGSLVVAKSETLKKKHENVGGITAIAVVISLIYIVFVFLGSWLEKIIFKNELDYIFRWFAPFLFVYPFELFCQNILVGDNKIKVLSIFRLAPKLLYLVSCWAWNQYISPLSLNSAFGLYLFSSATFIIFSIFRLKPSFNNLRHSIAGINFENKKYGFPLYLGALISFASAQLGGLSIAYFVDNINVGFFALAVTSTMPLALIPSTIGTTFFKEFTKMDNIPPKIFYATLGLSLIALIGFLFLIKPMVIFLYTEEYLGVVPLAYYTSIGAITQGFGDLLNRYISAHGRGIELRNSSFVIGIINIIGYTLIVYLIGVNGAAITRLVVGIVYLLLMYRIYKKHLKSGK